MATAPEITAYSIWLGYNNWEENFRFPVNPPEIEISEGSKGKTYDVAGIGEINVIQNHKLREISFSSFFPGAGSVRLGLGHDSSTDIIKSPSDYVKILEKWMGHKKPIRFVYSSGAYNVNTPVSIEKFSWKETAGTSGDIAFDLSLKEYVFYNAVRVKVAEDGKSLQKQKPARPDEKVKPKTYRLQAGDNLWKVAQKLLGNGSRYREIQQLNQLKDAYLKKLPIGLELRLP